MARFSKARWRRCSSGTKPRLTAESAQSGSATSCRSRNSFAGLQNPLDSEKGFSMAALDWSQCPAVESVPGRLSGAWVFRGTRMPVAAVFENLEDGMSIDEIVRLYDGLTREQVQSVLEFAARGLEVPTLAG